jgi:hypothetical protein
MTRLLSVLFTMLYQIRKLRRQPRLNRISFTMDKVWSRTDHTFSRWSPPTNLTLSMCSLSSNSSSLSVLRVAGSPDLTLTSLKLPISMFPFISHRLTKGLNSCGWSNRLTRDQTCQQTIYSIRQRLRRWTLGQSTHACCNRENKFFNTQVNSILRPHLDSLSFKKPISKNWVFKRGSFCSRF